MRMSCNGCRVLRKGCSDDCIIRPCLQWIKSPDAQANATLFIAKFYGRAGLINLLEAGPLHLRPSIFRSLLYEACGRIVNPIFGSVGLLWSGNWAQCQAAVDAVLRGSPIVQSPSSGAPLQQQSPPFKSYDIRHVFKNSNPYFNRPKSRVRFKHSSTGRHSPHVYLAANFASESTPSTHDSWMTQLGNGDSRDEDSMLSAETSAPLMNQTNQITATVKSEGHAQDGEVGLELTLGLGPM